MRATEFVNEDINPDVLDTRFSHRQQIGDYTYTAGLESDRFHKADLFVIRCYDGGKMIGLAKFYTTFGDSLVSALTTVQPEYQKSGIASTMYAYARMLGNTIEPSASQLPPGKRMWKAWKKSGEAQHLMREENITEGATDILYHYTGTSGAANIFKDGAFKLSRTTGNPSEESYAPPGYPYFLSTSRSKTGDYHRWVGTGGVMFVLNGQWFSQRYPVKPIDYWERSWQFSPGRTREAEDRVFSKESAIPLGGVTAVHVLLKEQDESRSPLTRTILIEAKKLGIPTYLYTDEAAWRLQDTRKTVPVSQAGELLSGPQSAGRMQRPMRGIVGHGRNSLMDWLEIIMKQPGQPLSPTADKLRYNIQYYGDMGGQLKNDLFNAKKPGSNDYELAGKLVAYMTKNKLTLEQLMDQLIQKWSKAA